MTWQFFLNFLILLPLFALALLFLLYKLQKKSPSFMWMFFYFFYFTLLFVFLFLPIPFQISFAPNKVFSQIQWNPFQDFAHTWKQSRIEMANQNPDFLIHFLLRNVFSFLLLMPFSDFLYSVLIRFNRRICWLLTILFSFLIQIFQFFLNLLGANHKISISGILLNVLGSALFFLLTYFFSSDFQQHLPVLKQKIKYFRYKSSP